MEQDQKGAGSVACVWHGQVNWRSITWELAERLVLNADGVDERGRRVMDGRFWLRPWSREIMLGGILGAVTVCRPPQVALVAFRLPRASPWLSLRFDIEIGYASNWPDLINGGQALVRMSLAEAEAESQNLTKGVKA